MKLDKIVWRIIVLLGLFYAGLNVVSTAMNPITLVFGAVAAVCCIIAAGTIIQSALNSSQSCKEVSGE